MHGPYAATCALRLADLNVAAEVASVLAITYSGGTANGQRRTQEAMVAYVSDETLDELRRELRSFKSASGHQSVYAAAHLAGAIEALIEEAQCDVDAHGPADAANTRW